jgi:hypothetical protein
MGRSRRTREGQDIIEIARQYTEEALDRLVRVMSQNGDP